MASVESGFVKSAGASIHYESMGDGRPCIMLHAGVADSRQWNNEFAWLGEGYRAIRYDLRGFGQSVPVDAEFSHKQDLEAVLEQLKIREPALLLGCSMGGTLAMDYALDNPARVYALVMVSSGPSGLKLDVPPHPLAASAEKAYSDGDLDKVAELETRIWFDGMGREAGDVDPEMRSLALEMNRTGLTHDAMHIGKQLPDSDSPAADRLAELNLPVLIIIGDQDIPYILAAADVMQSRIPGARRVVIEDAAHLANMDQPGRFQRAVTEFLADLPV
jgi:3-oxoadipate enol-lactonase